jgi:hypothetical protein
MHQYNFIDRLIHPFNHQYTYRYQTHVEHNVNHCKDVIKLMDMNFFVNLLSQVICI